MVDYIKNQIEKGKALDLKNPENHIEGIYISILLSMLLIDRTHIVNNKNANKILPSLNYFQNIFNDKKDGEHTPATIAKYKKSFKEFIIKNIEVINESNLKHENLVIKSRAKFETCLKMYLDFISKVLEDNVIQPKQDICQIANAIVLNQETNNIENQYRKHVENFTIPKIKKDADDIRSYHGPNMTLLATTETEIEYDSSDYRFFMVGVEQYSEEKMLDLIESAKDGKVDLVDAICAIYQINNLIQAHCDNEKDRLFIKL